MSDNDDDDFWAQTDGLADFKLILVYGTGAAGLVGIIVLLVVLATFFF